jgi:YegS/Rv2252/BmrU family lipid kinase
MSTNKIGIVFNPAKGATEALRDAVAVATDLPVTWHETSVDDPGVAATRDALSAGADLVIAAGGDGTVRAVAEHLADTDAAADLGIVPLGTGNLLARNLGVPLGDIAAALERALGSAPRAIDIGWADTGQERRAFAVMAGFGIDANMIAETDDDLKDRAGWIAYVESLGRALTASTLLELSLTIGDEVRRVEAHTLIVGNCGTLQGGFTLLPDADPSDGELDLVLFDADGFGGWVDTVKNVVWDNGIARLFGGADGAASTRNVTHARVRSFEIELDEPRSFEVDGDELGEMTRVRIDVQAEAVRGR